MKKVIKETRERKKTRTAVRGNPEKGTGNQGLRGRLTMAKWKEELPGIRKRALRHIYARCISDHTREKNDRTCKRRTAKLAT